MVVPIESYTNIRTVKELVLKKINLFNNINSKNLNDFSISNNNNLNYSIFEIRKKTQTIEEGFIEECEYVCDILSKWEKETESAYKQRESVFNYLYLKTYVHPVYSIEGDLKEKVKTDKLNKRSSLISNITGILEDDNLSSNNILKYSPTEILALNQLFYESTYDYLRGYFTLNSDEILDLGALKLVSEVYGKSESNNIGSNSINNNSEYSNEAYKKLEANIEKFIPSSYLDLMSKEEWSQRIMDKFMKIEEKDDILSKKNFLKILKKNEFFGTHQFMTKFTEDKNGPKSDDNAEIADYPEDILLCLTPECIKLYSSDKNLLSTFKLTNIVNWGISSNYFVFIVPKDEHIVMKVYLETNQAKNIQYLMDYYTMIIAGKSLKEIEAKSKENDLKFFNVFSYRDRN